MDEHRSTSGPVGELDPRRSESIERLYADRARPDAAAAPGAKRPDMRGRPIQALVLGDREAAFRVESLLHEGRDLLFETVTAKRLTSAIAMLRERPFDVVLLDIVLADSSLFDYIDEIRRFAPVTPLVVIGDVHHERSGLAAVQRGAQDYVDVDGVSPRSARRAIRLAIERQATENALRLRHDTLSANLRHQTDRCRDTTVQLRHETTLRLQTEQDLRSERDFVAAILDSAATLVIVLDGGGHIVRFNRACERLTGHAASEAVGRELCELLIEEDQKDAVQALLIQLREGHSPAITRSYWRTASGQRRLIEWTGTAVVTGGSTHIVCVGSDMTARFRAENELRRSERKLRLITDALPVLIAHIDAERRYTFANKAHSRWFGLSAGEIVGRPLVGIWGQHNWAQLSQPVADVLAGNPTHFEQAVVDGQGQRRNIAATLVPDFTTDGRVTGFFCLIDDITVRCRAEERARQLLLELAHVSRLNTMGGMASQLGHELTQPLTAIAIFSSACRRGLDAPEPNRHALADGLAEIDAQARRAGAIVQRLRRFARCEDVHCTNDDLNRLCADVVRLVHSEAELESISIDERYAGDLPAVRVDTILIQQVILNILQNAVQALKAMPGDRNIVLRTVRRAGRVVLEVADNGPGLPPGGTETVFASFFTTKKDGMGMGLSISRSIAEAHGGTLAAIEGSPCGAIFRLTLPMVNCDE